MSERFATLVADPPWDMKRGSQYRWREGRASGERRELDYEVMSVEAITRLGVEAVAADDCHLFLWVPGTYLEDAFGIVRAWGFRYSQMLVWAKSPRGWGPGGVFQSCVEFVVYARRGNPSPRQHTIPAQWWRWPRGKHSAKPEAFMDMVEAHFPAPRLELFARRGRLGWSAAGDEAVATVSVDGIAA